MPLAAMDSEIIWLIATVVATAGEIAIMGFFLAPFAVGCLLALIVDLVGGGTVLQVAAAVVGTVGSFLFLRPIAKRHLTGPLHPTNTAALVGQPAIVVDKIVNDEHVGSVRIGGEVWTAQTQDGALVLDAGEKVNVIEIRGATAVVGK